MTLANRYIELKREIVSAAEQAGRDPASIQLIVVTKNATLSQMQEAYSLGIRDFAESRLQSALEKIPYFPSDVTWHFIGQIQSNKAVKIIQAFDYIHSVATLKTLELLTTWGQKIGKHPHLLVQVNLSKETSKSGFTEQELLSLTLSRYPDVIGLMTMAPLTEENEVIRSCFHRLAQLRNALNLPHLSMGMTRDFPLAIAEGATLLRIGSYLY